MLANLDLSALDDEGRAALRFLVSAQALFMASANDTAAQSRWAAFAALSGKPDGVIDCSNMHLRLTSAMQAAQLLSTGTLESVLILQALIEAILP